MAQTQKDILLDWLRDAHAMENSLVSLLEKQAKKFDDKPMVAGKIREHLELTRGHRDRVKGLIERLGGETSTFKDMGGTFMANVQALMSATAPDAIVKNSLANYGIEHFEIASYRSLIAAAEAIGETEVKRVCQGILDEEVEMANWLQANLPRVTQDYLGQKAAAR